MTEFATVVTELADFFVTSLLAVKVLKSCSDVKASGGYKVLLEYLTSRVERKLPIKMVLPAFPAKSCNSNKTMGPRPDLCEYTALKGLVDKLRRINQINKVGAQLTMFFDYHTFMKYISVDPATHYTFRNVLEGMIQDLEGGEFIIVKSLRDFPEFDGKPETEF